MSPDGAFLATCKREVVLGAISFWNVAAGLSHTSFCRFSSLRRRNARARNLLSSRMVDAVDREGTRGTGITDRSSARVETLSSFTGMVDGADGVTRERILFTKRFKDGRLSQCWLNLFRMLDRILIGAGEGCTVESFVASSPLCFLISCMCSATSIC